MKFVDLHIHSYYSDGTYSPKEILAIAEQNNVFTISLTDHNELDGSRELMDLAKHSPVTCLPGVEIDCVGFERNIHVLAYNFDFEHAQFGEFVKRNRGLMEKANLDFIVEFAKKDSRVTSEDYNAYEYSRNRGRWKAVHYFVDRGVAASLDESLDLFFDGDFSYNSIPFPSMQQVINEIHLAGGVAIVAHPGRVFKDLNNEEFEEVLKTMISWGIDGIECYYPKHSEEQIDICLRLCEKHNLIITAGSDCHGEFGNNYIGEIQINETQISLNALQ